MPFSAEEFYKRVNGIAIQPEARFKQYTAPGGAGFLTPPDVDMAVFAELERDVDVALRAQGDLPNLEYMEIGRIRSKTTRDALKKRLSDLMHLRQTVNEQGTGTLVGGDIRPYYYDTLDPDAPITRGGIIAEQVSKQYKGGQIGRNQTTADLLQPSGRVIRASVVDRLYDQLTGKTKLPDRYAVFDIETTGLDPENSSMWQMSIRDNDGFEKTMYFDLDIPGTTKQGPLADTLLQGAKTRPITDVKEMLRILDDYPALVGQNLSFDLSFLDALSRQPALKNDPEAAQLFGRLASRAGTGEIFDTSQLSRHFLQMELAPELKLLSHNRIRSATAGSMENVILQSNLLEIMQDRYGVTTDEILEQATRAVHFSDVDTFFEDFYMREINRSMTSKADDTSVKLAYKEGGFNLSFTDDATANADQNAALRRLLVQNHALTPYMQMGYPQVDDAVLDVLRRTEGGDYVRSVDLDDPSWPKHYLGRIGSMDFAAVNPIEHQMIMARLQGPVGTASSSRLEIGQLVEGVQAHRQMLDLGVGSDLGAVGIAQGRLGAAGIPYANMSYEERLLSDVMAKGLPNSNIIDRILPRGQFYGKTTPEVLRSGRVVMPMDILRRAEEADVFNIANIEYDANGKVIGHDNLPTVRTRLGAGEELFHLRPFQFDKIGQVDTVKDVALNFAFSKDPDQAGIEIARFQEFVMDNFAELGISHKIRDQILNPDNVEDLRNYGIQVGTMLDRSGGGLGRQREVAEVYKTLVAVQGGLDVDLTDVNSTNLVAGIAEDPDDVGRFKIGGVLQPKGLTPEMRASYFEETKAAQQLHRLSANERASDPVLKGLEQSADGQKPFMALKLEDAMGNMGRYMKDHPGNVKGAIAASVAMTGYYFYRRRKQANAYFDETFEQQPNEEDGFYPKYQAEMHVGMASPYNSPRTKQDPLATAGAVQTLHSRRIGHTRMGNQKNDHLYGGSY